MVPLEDLDLYGPSSALILAELRYLEKRRKKDEHGYFTVESSYICNRLKLKRDKFLRDRRTLIDQGIIDVIQGQNQNIKTRYKIML